MLPDIPNAAALLINPSTETSKEEEPGFINKIHSELQYVPRDILSSEAVKQQKHKLSEKAILHTASSFDKESRLSKVS